MLIGTVQYGYCIFQGAANRKVAATNMNRESSRSHSVFTCTIESKVYLHADFFVRIDFKNLKFLLSRMFRGVTESLCLFVMQWELNSTTNFRFGRLNLVDLAGSER